MIPTDNIAKIEVIYGTDAIGGIILITTKNGKDNPGGKISLEINDYKGIPLINALKNPQAIVDLIEKG